ncbi:GNAT family N-acetyltransferase [Candidatus Bathyarchaeota archaeon]|nr:GNAT family N-acetyltransferase [Candidatus Bathyarchaeota archaeon]
MEIRQLTIDDYKRIVGLWKKAKLPFKCKGRDSAEAIEVQMSKDSEFFLGAFEGDELVGVVIISCDQRKGWINRLSVHPEHRHKGIAKALIAESEKKLRKRGINIFCALVEDFNVASKELFKECGYTEHGDIIYFSKRDNDEA